MVLLRILIVAIVLLVGCDSQETSKETCNRSTVAIPLTKRPGPDYGNVVLILSGDVNSPMLRCTGTIVGQNSVMTAASCLGDKPESIFVVKNFYSQKPENGSELQPELLNKAIKPQKIISHGTVAKTTSGLDPQKYLDDLAILVFEDNGFLLKSLRSKALINSLYDTNGRPKNNALVEVIGYGSKPPSQVDSRLTGWFYKKDDALGKDLIFTAKLSGLEAGRFSEETNRLYPADRGAPMFISHNSSYYTMSIVAILTTIQDTIPSTGDESKRGVYVDLYSERSISLLKKARVDGARFLTPEDIASKISVVKPKCD